MCLQSALIKHNTLRTRRRHEAPNIQGTTVRGDSARGCGYGECYYTGYASSEAYVKQGLYLVRFIFLPISSCIKDEGPHFTVADTAYAAGVRPVDRTPFTAGGSRSRSWRGRRRSC